MLWSAGGVEVGRQSDLFRAALPGLLAGPLVGRWIVWSDGVVSDHADEHGALLDAHALRLVAPAEDP